MSLDSGYTNVVNRYIRSSLSALLLTALVACGGDDELRDIERGTDDPPAIEGSPPAEGN